jgi:hypothetical protein
MINSKNKKKMVEHVITVKDFLRNVLVDFDKDAFDHICYSMKNPEYYDKKRSKIEIYLKDTKLINDDKMVEILEDYFDILGFNSIEINGDILIVYI